MPGRLLLKYAWAHVLEQAMHGAYFARRGRFLSWLDGVRAGLTGLGPFLRERKRLQASRRVSPRDLEKLFSIRPLFRLKEGSPGRDKL
jgi:hypothetical protein